MFTPENLLALAEEYEKKYKELLVLYPAGTVNDERNEARKNMDDAFDCASWMEANGIQEISHVGPFNTFTVSKGQFVKVKKGAVVYSTAPDYTREGKENSQVYGIKVHDFYKGQVYNNEVTNPTVHWVGRHGYWKWCNLSDVELAE